MGKKILMVLLAVFILFILLVIVSWISLNGVRSSGFVDLIPIFERICTH